jgi:hypothetical protein
MSTTDARVTRLTALGAVAVALLYAVSLPVGSLTSAPACDASSGAVVRFFGEHRAGLLAALVLNGIAWCALMPAVFVGLRAQVGERGAVAGTVALVCAALEAALIGVALLLCMLVAYETPYLSPQLAKVLADAVWIALSVPAWPTVPCVLGLVLAGRWSGALPTSVIVVGLVVAAVHAATAVGFARSGMLAPTGIGAVAAPAFAIWLLVIGVALLRRPVVDTSVVPAAARATTPMPG